MDIVFLIFFNYYKIPNPMVGMTRLPRLRIRFLKRGHIEIHLRFTYLQATSPFYISNVSDATVSVPLSSVDKIRLLFL